MATTADPLELRYLAADYSRLIGLRAVPLGIAFFLLLPLWSLRPNPVVGFYFPLAAALALVGTLAADGWYKRHYGSATALTASRRQAILLLVVGAAITGAILLIHPPLGSPIWGSGIAVATLGFPFQGGGWHRVRWHFVVAGAAMVFLAPAPFPVATGVGGGILALLGLVDHLLFVRRMRSPSGKAG